MNNGNNRRRVLRRGFTLMELLLVLVILGVLAALVIPKFTGRSEQARETAAKADIASIKLAINTFEIDNGRYPTTDEGLGALITKPANVSGWRQPYLDGGMPKDPWGNEYQYRYPGQRNAQGFDLWSFGPDGRESEDDIGNWQ
ncbi:MAG: type II secretion system major pseudopilin GspG [Phycisphaerales bacterium]|nr:type II secretion system major pseudopilin GspG [Phycisphaerales bacterium]